KPAGLPCHSPQMLGGEKVLGGHAERLRDLFDDRARQLQPRIGLGVALGPGTRWGKTIAGHALARQQLCGTPALDSGPPSVELAAARPALEGLQRRERTFGLWRGLERGDERPV